MNHAALIVSEETMLIGFLSFVVAVLVGTFELWDHGKEPEEQRSSVVMWYLPIYFLLYLAVAFWRGGTKYALMSVVSGWFGVFLHIAIYYALLLPCLPLLRKYLSARACAGLWTIPSFLYVFMQRENTLLRAPKLVLLWPGWGIKVAAVLWAVGFAAVMIWHTVNHLRYRRELLQEAKDETDSEILALWQEMQQAFGIKEANLRLVRSPVPKTPLTIGVLSREAVRVVLPEKDYTEEELRLIFRHELIHIQRNDCWTKLFLLFYAAMCWFLPLMWVAIRRSADDLELSCDEAVLEKADDSTRRRYAELILNSVGDQRGYTTCLSASASALRYRLKSIVQPRRRLPGALTMALITFVLFFTVGNVGLAYGGTQGKDLQLHDKTGFSAYTVERAERFSESYCEKCVKPEELLAYLDSLTLYEITGGSSNMTEWGKREMVVVLADTPINLWVYIYDHVIVVEWYEGEIREIGKSYALKQVSHHYYLKEKLDWEYLHSLMEKG